jgi:hypothetical protein
MDSPTILTVDFNRLNDDDVLWLPRASAPPVTVGRAVILRDREGNQCLGYVESVDQKRVTARAELSTWMDSSPVTVLETSNTLDEVLASRARLIRRTSNPTESTRIP